MKRIHACVLILVFVVFAISTEDDEICSASLFSNSNRYNKVLVAVKSPTQTDCDSCLATLLEQLVNAHITEVWFLRVEVTRSVADSIKHASFSHRDVTVLAGRAPPACPTGSA